MRRIAWLLLLTVILGCDSEPARRKSQPIPPDDMSNGPWKYQKQRAAEQQSQTETPPPAEPD